MRKSYPERATPLEVSDWSKFARAMESDLAEILQDDLAAEGATGGVYILGTTQLGIESPFFRGATSQILAATYRDSIEWRGDGPAVLINNGGDWAIKPGDSFGLFAATAKTAAIIIHEMAHLLTSERMHNHKLASETALPVQLRAELARESREITLDEICSNWLTHCPRWIRAVLHLSHRLQSLGWNCRPQLSWPVGLSRPEKYGSLIGDELSRLEGVPLMKIVQSPAPDEFIKQWRNDCEQWCRLIQE